MSKIRWGICCKFKEAPIKFRSTTVAHLKRLRDRDQSHTDYIESYILDNLQALEQAIDYCSKANIGSFRVSSEFLPVYKHAELGYSLSTLPQAKTILQKFQECKILAANANIRLTFHPDQFVVLNSPHCHVIQNSINELEYHGEIAELLGADSINIHLGGVYGNKLEAITRFIASYALLSERVQMRLTLENDDQSYHVEDLLPICHQLKIPLTYDVHHHRCYRDALTIQQASQLAYETWNREPLFHLSSPKEGWSSKQPKIHCDFIDINDFPKEWLNFSPLTIDIEAKAKELAIFQLQAEFSNMCNKDNYS